MRNTTRRLSLLCVFPAALVALGCWQVPPVIDPIEKFLPALPPAGGAIVGAAGVLTEANYATERVAGPGSQGLIGDYYMRNDKVRIVVQAPGRALGPCPFGGNIIDMDRVDAPAGDQLGEVAPFLQLGRTVDFRKAEVVRDGAAGGAVVLRFRGHDAIDDFINVTGLGGFAQALQDDYRPTVDLGLDVAVTYVLEPGATHVQILYTFYNPSLDVERKTLFGTISDTGAQIEVLHPGIGFGEFAIADLFGSAKIPLVEYAAFQGDGIAYGILPRFADNSVRGFPFPVAGVAVMAFDVKDKTDVLGSLGQSLTVPTRGGANRKVELLVGRDAGDIERQVRERKGEAVTAISGKVTTQTGGLAVAGARVVVENGDLVATDPTHAQVTVLVSATDGSFSGGLPPGNYRLTAEGEHYLRGSGVNFVVAGAPVTNAALSIPDAARLDYKVRDRAGNFIPAKVMVVGATAAPPDKRFRDTSIDHYPLGIAGWIASREGDSSKNTRWDHPLALLPGHYRVVIGRGPEWSRFEKVVDLALGTPVTIDATLDRVVDTAGYVACDFHQHTNMSPDSPVPPADRVVTYLAEGVEFVSTSEHDVHFDYKPVIKSMDAARLLDSIVGVEVTPFAYGHFIGFPVRVDPLSPNGGAVDWAEHPVTGLDLSPAEIFAGLRGAGAQAVQVNHPRSVPGGEVIATFQKSFDRAALGFDFQSRSFGGNTTMYPVKAVELGLPAGAELFSPTFDTLEVTNGWSYRTAGDERVDALTDTNLRDWMNFLSFGFTPTALGNSDSHQWVSSPAGLPRSLVRIPDDSADAILMGVGDDVVRTVTGKATGGRDVIVTNTPLIKLAADDKGIGAVVTHTGGGPLKITVHVESPTWAPVDTVEIFANSTFDVPIPKGQATPPLIPTLCYTTRGAPTARCSAAVGGARAMTVQTIDLGNGAARFQIDITEMIDPATLIAGQRAGAQGKDLWLVARVTGDVALFPTIPEGIFDPNDIPGLVDGTVGTGKGIPAFAFTNPIFVDVDGSGWRAPFAP